LSFGEAGNEETDVACVLHHGMTLSLSGFFQHGRWLHEDCVEDVFFKTMMAVGIFVHFVSHVIIVMTLYHE